MQQLGAIKEKDIDLNKELDSNSCYDSESDAEIPEKIPKTTEQQSVLAKTKISLNRMQQVRVVQEKCKQMKGTSTGYEDTKSMLIEKREKGMLKKMDKVMMIREKYNQLPGTRM